MCRNLALAVGLMGIVGCGDDAAAPCAVIEQFGEVTLICPDSTTSWAVPACGNHVVEAGEACDDATRACTSACTPRPGVACTADDAVCVCDPALYPTVPHVDTSIFYNQWIDLDEVPPMGHAFTGAGGDPGGEFATRGELAFACDLGTGAPTITIAPLRRRSLAPTPTAAISPALVAAVPTTAPTLPTTLRPGEWLAHTLIVISERGQAFAVEVPFYESPCLGTIDDANLLIEHTARGLSCPSDL